MDNWPDPFKIAVYTDIEPPVAPPQPEFAPEIVPSAYTLPL